VESAPGEGAEFKIFLPVADPLPNSEPAAPAPLAAAGNETILVAEDESMVRDIAVRILAGAGYRTLEAADGEEALRVFEANRENVDLILLDVVMPKLGGHEVYGRIRAMRPEAAVVFCTGYDPETAGSQFLREEGLNLVEKPFNGQTLLHAVRATLDRQRPCPASTA
jgi:CheY-like chemotaxis protein